MPSKSVFLVSASASEEGALAAQLDALGYEPVRLPSCDACLDELGQKQPLLVLLDLNLSPMRGDECCRRIKEWHRSPVILMTEGEQPHEVMYCWRAAADDFLPKPIAPARLAAKLAVLEEAAPGGAGAGGRRQGGKSVLLAEPSRFYRNVIGGNLEQAGLQVLYAGEGEEALELAREHAGSLDGALLDVVLPGKSGLDVAAELRALPELAGKPILLMSGSGVPDAALATARRLRAELLDKRSVPVEYILSMVHQSLKPELAELRSSERKPFFSFVEFTTGEEERWDSGFSYDISTGGLFVRTLNPGPANARVKLRIRFAGQTQPSVSGGVVAWSNPYRQRASFAAPVGMGVRLLDVDHRLREQVARLVRPANAEAPKATSSHRSTAC